jgi:hypothetical protein
MTAWMLSAMTCEALLGRGEVSTDRRCPHSVGLAFARWLTDREIRVKFRGRAEVRHLVCIAVAFFVAGVVTTAATDSVDWDEQQWGLEGVRCEINLVVVVDNAGRKWEIRPGGSGRAKRLAWYHVVRNA